MKHSLQLSIDDLLKCFEMYVQHEQSKHPNDNELEGIKASENQQTLEAKHAVAECSIEEKPQSAPNGVPHSEVEKLVEEKV